MDKDRKLPKPAGYKSPASEQPPSTSGLAGPKTVDADFNAELEELQRRLQAQMGRSKSGDPMAAALDAVERMTTEADSEEAASNAIGGAGNALSRICAACGHSNRVGYKFCGMCGQPVESVTRRSHSKVDENFPAGFAALPRAPWVGGDPGSEQEEVPSAPPEPGTHHYHHHYHHHYFPDGQPGTGSRAPVDGGRDTEKPRPAVIVRGEAMSRSEAAVRRISQEWVLACNTKHLDNLLELYVSDALVLRSNIPPVRGAASVREFFFGALDSGLGEVEIDPIRVEVVGDMAYEAGRCKALVPGATGKRREERGKYIWVLARQSNGEWKLLADCWSSDLTLSAVESDIAPTAGAKPAPPRKTV